MILRLSRRVGHVISLYWPMIQSHGAYFHSIHIEHNFYPETSHHCPRIASQKHRIPVSSPGCSWFGVAARWKLSPTLSTFGYHARVALASPEGGETL